MKYLGQSDEAGDKLFHNILAGWKFKYYDIWFRKELFKIHIQKKKRNFTAQEKFKVLCR